MPEASLLTCKIGTTPPPWQGSPKAQSVVQARKGSDAARLLPFRSRQPAAASSREPSGYGPLRPHGPLDADWPLYSLPQAQSPFPIFKGTGHKSPVLQRRTQVLALTLSQAWSQSVYLEGAITGEE